MSLKNITSFFILCAFEKCFCGSLILDVESAIRPGEDLPASAGVGELVLPVSVGVGAIPVEVSAEAGNIECPCNTPIAPQIIAAVPAPMAADFIISPMFPLP